MAGQNPTHEALDLTPKALFKSCRFGLEYEALFNIINTDLIEAFNYKAEKINWKTKTIIPNTIPKLLKPVIDYLLNPRLKHCHGGVVSRNNINKSNQLIKRHLLCMNLNQKVKDAGLDLKNTTYFRVNTTASFTIICDGPPTSIPMQIPPFSFGIDNKYSWGVTHDGSVNFDGPEKDLPENILENMELVSPPLKVINAWGIIEPMLSKVFNNNDKFKSFHNTQTSNHVHFTLYSGDAPSEASPAAVPIWREEPTVLYKMCMVWWHFEPVFMMLCKKQRRSNEFCSGMHVSICERYDAKPTELQNVFNCTEKLDKFVPSTENFDRDLAGDIFYVHSQDKHKKVRLELMQIIYFFQGNPGDQNTRYASLNLLNTLTDVTTIESRLYEGSTDPKEVMSWINLIVLFFSSFEQIYTNIQNNEALRKLSWALNTSFNSYDWNTKVVLDPVADIKFINNLVICFKTMMSYMGVPSECSFYTHWEQILRKHIKDLYTTEDLATAPVSQMITNALPISPPKDLTLSPVLDLINKPFLLLSLQKGGKKKKEAAVSKDKDSDKVHVFLYGMEELKDIAKVLGVKRIKKELGPVKATLPDYQHRNINGHIVVSKKKGLSGQSVPGIIISVQKSMLPALGSNWVTHQVRDQNASIIKCKMAGKVEGKSTNLTPEQNKKIATALKHAERYIV